MDIIKILMIVCFLFVLAYGALTPGMDEKVALCVEATDMSESRCRLEITR